MPTLHVRSVPNDVYEQLRSLAQLKQRSLSAQVVAMLQRALEAEAQQQRQEQLLDAIHRRRFAPQMLRRTARICWEDRLR
ncbi:MAG: hypothetical protein R2854_17770 [Caldilineaceae bacterium]